MIKLPDTFANRMKEILGDDYDNYIASFEVKHKQGLRVNTSKISVEDFLKISPYLQLN